MSDEEKKPDPVEQAAKNEAEDRLKAEDEAAREKAEAEERKKEEEESKRKEAARIEAEAKECETPKKQEPLKKTASGRGRGLSLAGNRKRK